VPYSLWERFYGCGGRKAKVLGTTKKKNLPTNSDPRPTCIPFALFGGLLAGRYLKNFCNSNLFFSPWPFTVVTYRKKVRDRGVGRVTWSCWLIKYFSLTSNQLPWVPDAGSLKDKWKPPSKDFQAYSVATEENTDIITNTSHGSHKMYFCWRSSVILSAFNY
jgi:hypothetical protein